jgi:dipeptidyl aminopeptidase/acylaminoacyl peptidase
MINGYLAYILDRWDVLKIVWSGEEALGYVAKNRGKLQIRSWAGGKEAVSLESNECRLWSCAPDGFFLFLDSQNRLHAINVETGARNLVNIRVPTLPYLLASPEPSSCLIAVEEKDSGSSLHLLDFDSQTSHQIYQSKNVISAVTCKGNKVAVVERKSAAPFSDHSLVSLLYESAWHLKKSHTVVPISPVQIEKPTFSRHGQSLFYLSDVNGHAQLWECEGENGPVLKYADHKDVKDFALSGLDACYLCVRDAHQESLWFQQKSGANHTAPAMTSFTCLSTSPGGAAAYVSSSPQTPPHIVVGDNIVNPNEGILDLTDHPPLITEKLFWYSKDGTKIHGVLYHAEHGHGKKPLIVLVHSGPFERHSVTWPVKARYLCSIGFAVLYVNYRGSTGYGRAFAEALGGAWVDRDADDIAGAFTTLSALSLVDLDRVAIWGGDVAAMTALHTTQKYPVLFKAAVLVYPTFEPDLTDPTMRFLVGNRSCFAEATRNAFCVASAKQNYLVFQGAADRRAKLEDTKRLVASLRDQGQDVSLKVFDNEGHQWKLRSTYENYYEITLKFLSKLTSPSSLRETHPKHPDDDFSF